MDIRGSSAIVSGAASGLGLATVEHLLERGAAVVALDLPGDQASAALARFGTGVRFAPGDVTDDEAVQAAVDAASALGPVRVAVNCAGIADAARVLGRSGPAPLAHFERVLRVNLLGTINLTRLAARAMAATELIEGGRGVILNTASVAAFDGQVGQAAYAASKGGVQAMTLPLAREFAAFAIRVVTIAPGVMATPMLAAMADEVRRSLGDQVPYPARLGRPAEFAALAMHVIANDYLNGETIRLDGALRMGPT